MRNWIFSSKKLSRIETHFQFHHRWMGTGECGSQKKKKKKKQKSSNFGFEIRPSCGSNSY